ncbi:hypothetical protein T265_07303 [Opisthorchis viverrini]|uniref:Uncharacterized protein n=1 Tax=Opisthorchis viverrini TaxID=6198 RepID=A0A074ZPG0_OPIVI|nr:hypothetical protein T265_07303 [Opisthorchis viverrini]KER25200.1 hypothetical protein T265_07303 [Opisthorchis viverrini]
MSESLGQITIFKEYTTPQTEMPSSPRFFCDLLIYWVGDGQAQIWRHRVDPITYFKQCTVSTLVPNSMAEKRESGTYDQAWEAKIVTLGSPITDIAYIWPCP